MNFQTAIRTCLKKYATFSGRAKRPEYWWFILFIVVSSIVLNILDTLVFGTGSVRHGPGYWGYRGNNGPLGGLFWLAMLLPSIAVGVRRLHDIGKSGWWLLIAFFPLLGGLVLLYFMVQPSQPGPNQFGARPGKTPPPPDDPWGSSGIPPVPRD